jgi:hypothetical protein
MLKIENITGVNFIIWRSKMEYVITIKHLQLPIEAKPKKPSSMTYEECEKLDPKIISTPREYLTNMIYFHVFVIYQI